MKCKGGKKPEGGSKEVGNERGLVSMFQTQRAANDVNKAREHGRHIRIHEDANSRSCQCVEELQEEVPSRSTASVTRPGSQSSLSRSNVCGQLSRDFGMWLWSRGRVSPASSAWLQQRKQAYCQGACTGKVGVVTGVWLWRLVTV